LLAGIRAGRAARLQGLVEVFRAGIGGCDKVTAPGMAGGDPLEDRLMPIRLRSCRSLSPSWSSSGL
jgi:hypothetical protein